MPRRKNVGYTMVGPTGGMTTSTRQPGPPPGKYGSVQGGDGGSVSNGAYLPTQPASASCTGEIDQVYTWQGTDPAPQDVIVTQTCTAKCQGFTNWPGTCGTPTCNDGLQDAPTVNAYTILPNVPTGIPGSYVSAISTGKHYKVMPGGASFMLSCTPSASVTAGYGNCSTSVSYSGTISPVTIQITGTWDPIHSDYWVLTGQQIKATLTGIVGTVTSYKWSVGGDAFKTYDPTLPSNQLVLLGSADLTGPATGTTGVAPLLFYDRKQENLTVTCNISFTAPDGTPLSVSATSPQIQVLKPAVSNWGIDTGYVQSFQYPDQQGQYHDIFGLLAPPNATQQGQSWHDVVVTVSSPFAGGMFCFAQLSTPNRKIYRHVTKQNLPGYFQWPNNGQQGLDNSFPFLSKQQFSFSQQTVEYPPNRPRGTNGG